jgi:hypothetical protein
MQGNCIKIYFRVTSYKGDRHCERSNPAPCRVRIASGYYPRNDECTRPFGTPPSLILYLRINYF